MNIEGVAYEELTHVMKQYYKIKTLHLDKIVMFQLGDFYEMFFEDAITIASKLELTLTSKNAGLSEKIPMCGVPLSSKNDYIKKIIDFKYTVVIVDQIESEDLTKKLVDREVVKIISPGTYLEENNQANNFVGSIDKTEEYNLCFGDVSTGELFTYSNSNFDNIVNEIINLSIKELVYSDRISKENQEILANAAILKNELELKETELTNSKLFFENRAEENLIKYLNYTQVGVIGHLQKIQKLNEAENMFLSANSKVQLELVKSLSEGSESLLDYLNGTSTAMGKRLLKQSILHPFKKEADILARHQVVEQFLNNPINRYNLIDSLKKIYDFERLAGKVAAQTVTPRELENLKKSIFQLPGIYQELNEIGINNQEIDVSNPDQLVELQELIEQAITEDAPNTIKDGGYIKAGFSYEIDDLRSLKNNSDQWLVNFEQEEIEKTGIKKLRIKYNKIFGYFIEVTNSFLSLVPEHYIRKQTMANCERYVTTELKNEERKILNAEQLLLAKEYAEFKNLREKIQVYIPRLQKVASLVARIDLLLGFAQVTYQENLSRPHFNNQHSLVIKNAWHPIVRKNVENFIENDVALESGKDICIITGPNMAGKSTYMRTVGLISIIAQVGCFVPAQSCNIKIFDGVYTRIGSSDDISKGTSTFMMEMIESREALNNATRDSLLIFDELGRGTSTYDGIAIATAILKELALNLKCKTLFSTHYHELIELGNDTKYPNINVVHVKAAEENDELTFYHKVLPGGSTKSYGIQVAALAGLAPRIIKGSQNEFSRLEQRKLLNSNGNEEENYGEANQDLLFEKKKEAFDQLEAKIKQLKISELTPIEALVVLNEIKENYEKTEK